MNNRERKMNYTGEKITDRERYLFKGPVKQVMETCYKAHLKDGEVIQGKLESDSAFQELNYITTFNEKGMREYEELFGTNDFKSQTYNDQGLPLKSVQQYNGGSVHITNHVWGEKGESLEVTSTDENGKIAHQTRNTYNDLGQQLESITEFTGNPKSNRRTVRTYGDFIKEINGNKYRNLLTSIEYNGEGGIECEMVKTYNKEGLEIESIQKHTDEKRKQYDHHTKTKYNVHGDAIETTYFNADGSVKNVYTNSYEYDSDGKKIVKPHKPYNPFELGPGETEKFEEDHHGNWTKKTTFFKGKPVNMMLRQHSYYGEPSENEKPFVHLLSTMDKKEVADVSKNVEAMEPEDAKWLAEGIAQPETFPLHRYYALKFKELPSVVTYPGSTIEAMALREMLKENLDAQVIHSYSLTYQDRADFLSRYTLSFPLYPGYLLQASGINRQDKDEYIVPSHIDDLLEDYDHVHFSQFQLLRPSDVSAKRDEFFEEQLNEYINDCAIEREPEKPFINIVEVSGNSFAMVEHPVDDDFEIRDLDVNYGYGFEEFHTELMKRFATSTKGLVLFHGEPGTGKTYYIRHLLRQMAASKKVVIYMPPNMVDHLVEPGFMTFLAAEVRNWSADGNFCVLLIEDAEPLLAKRQEGVRIQGVTNLLNLSDGLLNDMLNLQIICTFNVDLKKLDSALLRPGRLIARKEFKALSELDANLLAQRLGIKHTFKGPATLGEIYALRKNQNTLIHDVAPDRDASTILDDL